LPHSPNDPEFVTASEVADYVFCKHSWHLRRQGATVSEKAQSSMSAGVQWQDRKDGVGIRHRLWAYANVFTGNLSNAIVRHKRRIPSLKSLEASVMS
jgi:hypothetical protein